MYVRTHIHTYLRTYVRMYVRTYTHTDMKTYRQTCTPTDMHTYARMHACRHIIHTFAHATRKTSSVSAKAPTSRLQDSIPAAAAKVRPRSQQSRSWEPEARHPADCKLLAGAAGGPCEVFMKRSSQSSGDCPAISSTMAIVR